MAQLTTPPHQEDYIHDSLEAFLCNGQGLVTTKKLFNDAKKILPQILCV